MGKMKAWLKSGIIGGGIGLLIGLIIYIISLTNPSATMLPLRILVFPGVLLYHILISNGYVSVRFEQYAWLFVILGDLVPGFIIGTIIGWIIGIIKSRGEK